MNNKVDPINPPIHLLTTNETINCKIMHLSPLVLVLAHPLLFSLRTIFYVQQLHFLLRALAIVLHDLWSEPIAVK